MFLTKVLKGLCMLLTAGMTYIFTCWIGVPGLILGAACVGAIALADA